MPTLKELLEIAAEAGYAMKPENTINDLLNWIGKDNFTIQYSEPKNSYMGMLKYKRFDTWIVCGWGFYPSFHLCAMAVVENYLKELEIQRLISEGSISDSPINS